jgi:membrane protease subunit HflK
MSEIKEIKTGSTTGAFFFLAILVIIAGLFLFKASFFYQLESYEKAVVFTLGKVGEDPVGEGFHGRLPWPIQEVEIVNTEKDRRIQIGFRSDVKGGRIHKPKQASMLTRDANIVDLEVEVNYTISDVVNYIIKMHDQEETMRDISESALNSVIGLHHVQEVLTSQKAEIANEVKTKLQGLVDEYELGLNVSRVQFLKVLNPEEVRAAYEGVESAKQDSVISVEKALAYENREIPSARADSIEWVKSAEGFALARVAEAEGNVAEFNALYGKYKRGKKVMRKRLYLETLETVLPNKKKIIMESGASHVNLLHLGGVK